MSDGLRSELDYPKRLAILGSIVGLTALGLAVVGLFGVTAFVVGQRRHEVGVRVALGASRAGIIRLLLRDSLRPVAFGLAVGFVAALMGAQLIKVRLYGISAQDPLAILAAIVVLLAAATAAVILPARRAASVDPAQVLRQS